MIIKPIKTRIFHEGENLLAFIIHYFKRIPERSVIVITSKIVSLSEKRTVSLKNKRTKENLIRSESEFALPTKYVWLTIKEGVVMASAGIDESNGNGKFILLPKNAFKTASFLRRKLQEKYRVKKLGLLITDSRTMPLRAGITGFALGYAGFRGIKDYRGKTDIFKRKFKFSRTNVADSLATAAIFMMGEGNEQQPLAIIKNAPIEFCNKLHRKELHIKIRDDMYQPLFNKLNKF